MLHIHLFGHLRLFVDGRPQKFSALPKATPLLAYILLNRSTHIPRDTLAYTLWPDVPESEAKANLRRHLHELRRNLPPAPESLPWILAETQQVQWNPAAPVWIDVAEFEIAVQQPDRRVEAAALYTGDLLQNVYEEWLEPERERLRNLYLQTLEQLVERSRQQADLLQAINYCQQILHYDPWRENIIRALMRLRLESGDRAGALQEYQRFKQRLHEELGVAPMPETRALYQDMVDNRIKTPERPQKPELTAPTSPTPPRPRHNLPAALMACIGREQEITTLVDLLQNSRLVTLTGPGGIGKTRLSLEVATHIFEQRPELCTDGVFYVRLSDVRDVNLIAPAIAEAVGLKTSAAEPAWDQLVHYLRDKRVLLVLDNFEQLLPAAAHLTHLLHAAASLRLLVTSQALLHIYGEHEFAVPPLTVPLTGDSSITNIRQSPAVAWFVAVARTTNPSFTITPENVTTIAQICVRLEGVPLAIELAAARSKLFSPAIILSQLNNPLNFLTGRARDLPARQRTLREAITWSYNLLTATEKALFAALSVFAGSFSLEAAVTICGRPGDEGQTYNDLESLLDKNILRLANRPEDGSPRFRMLLVIRDYAREQLDSSAAAIYLQHHLQFFSAFAERAGNTLYGPDQLFWLERLAEEDDNIRAALEWAFADAATAQQVDAGCIIIFNLSQRYWQIKGRIGEGRDWSQRALQHRSLLAPEPLLRLLNHGGWLAQLQEDYQAALAMHEEALDLTNRVSDSRLTISTLHYLGAVAGRTGDYGRAESLLNECQQLMRQNADTTPLALSTLLNNLGIVQRRLKKYGEAVATLNECLEMKKVQGDKTGIAAVLSNLGMVYTNQGDYESGRRYLVESLNLRREVNDRLGIMHTLSNIAQLALEEKQWLKAVHLQAVADVLRQEMNLPLREESKVDLQELIQKTQEQVGDSRFAAAWREGLQMPLLTALNYAVSDHPLPPADLPTQWPTTSMPLSGSVAVPTPTILHKELLAIGGMGKVYKGVLAETGQTVVIKQIKSELIASHPELLLRFQREAESLRQLNHPNIVKILATIADPQEPAIILEYVPGGSLRERLDQQGALPIPQLLRFSLELADALTRAHHLNIVHRDLKPANILLGIDGSVRLTDFGIAYLASQEQRLTQTGAIMGTAAYLSPEACLGEEVDARSDIWAFGVILIEMLTGKNPFAGSSFTATVATIVNKPLPDLRPHRPDAPVDLINLIQQMLKKNRAERINSSRQIAAALEQIQRTIQA